MSKPGRKPLPKGERKIRQNMSLSPDVVAHLGTKNSASAYVEALIRGDMQMRDYKKEWKQGNDTGEGYAIEQSELDQMELIKASRGDWDVAAYQAPGKIVLVGDANGLWAVDVSND